ncbi:ABC transporter substrate-binding protein [Antarctobacter sp.]|uniref:ABC transporter substrate-binding protein n=1 Tax=Antarctobacter sp. TaxID=1872577 RepID=UPI003A911DCD
MTPSDISRRLFMGLAGAGLAAATLPASMVRAQGRKLLVTVINNDPAAFNPAVSTNIEGIIASTPVYSWLIKQDIDGTNAADLATDWSMSEDGKTFTFTLRDDVTWHDGTPFTAEDVKFTIEEMLSVHNSIAKNAYATLSSVEAPDTKTIILTFSAPNVVFLAQPFALGPILPKHLWEGTDFNTNPVGKSPVGTGPFKFVAHEIGNKIEYTRNEAYFGEAPGMDGLLLRIMPDPVSRSAAFENKEIDAINVLSIPFTDITRFREMPGVTMKSFPAPGGAYLAVINMRNKPLDDVRVRRALAHAIDRSFIRENILPEISHAMNGPIWPASPLYNTELEDYSLDTAKAEALLDEAGVTKDANGKRFTLRVMWQNVFSQIGSIADVMAENLRPLGIEVDRTPLETSAVIQKGYIEGDFDIIINSYVLGPDPSFGVERLYNSNNILPKPFTNNSGYVNKEVDALFDKQRLAGSPEERKAIYDEIQSKIWDDLPVLPICSYDAVGFSHDEFVTDVYTHWNVIMEDFATAKPA